MQGLEESELIQLLFDKAKYLFSTKNLFLYMQAEDTEDYKLVAASKEFSPYLGYVLDNDHLNIINKVIETKKPVDIENYSTLFNRHHFSIFNGVENIRAFPLISNNTIIGVLGYTHKNDLPEVNHNTIY